MKSPQNSEQDRIRDDLVEQIQVMILEGELSPGEQLPPGEELCEKFQVGNETLHDALRVLGQKNLLQIPDNPNGAIYVKDANAELMAENLAMLIRSHNISLEHLTEFREGIEGTVANLAACRITASDSKRLATLIDEAAQCMEDGVDGWNRLVQVDEKIHIEVAIIAGNPLYTFVLLSVHESIHRYYDKFLIVGDVEMDENYQDLQLIVEAITDRDSERAQKIAEQHVRRFSRYMEHKKRQDPKI